MTKYLTIRVKVQSQDEAETYAYHFLSQVAYAGQPEMSKILDESCKTPGHVEVPSGCDLREPFDGGVEFRFEETEIKPTGLIKRNGACGGVDVLAGTPCTLSRGHYGTCIGSGVKVPKMVGKVQVTSTGGDTWDPTFAERREYTYTTEVRNEDGVVIHHPGDVVEQFKGRHGQWLNAETFARRYNINLADVRGSDAEKARSRKLEEDLYNLADEAHRGKITPRQHDVAHLRRLEQEQHARELLSGDNSRPGYYAVCYAHVCRWEKAKNAQEACMLAFGLVDVDKMTVRRFPSNPKYTPLKTRTPWLQALYARHKEKTGNDIG